MKQTVSISFLIMILIGGISAQEECHFVPATSTTGDTANFTFSGGSFASFGCAPIDPTYWLAGLGPTITATFVEPQDYPTFRIWGMNDDDVAILQVDGVDYFLDGSSASIAPKVVCGLSPGPDGVEFTAEGYVVGSNDNFEGNYSYNDVTVAQNGVESLTITSVSGAGWGFAGVSVDCPLAMPEFPAIEVVVYPNPTAGILFITGSIPRDGQYTVTDLLGQIVWSGPTSVKMIDLTGNAPGVYVLTGDPGSGVVRKLLVRE